MRTAILKAALISLGVYAVIVLLGVWIGLWLILALIPVFQVGWGLFCCVRLIQLTREHAYRLGALTSDRASFGFALGGLVSSSLLLTVMVILSQAD